MKRGRPIISARAPGSRNITFLGQNASASASKLNIVYSQTTAEATTMRRLLKAKTLGQCQAAAVGSEIRSLLVADPAQPQVLTYTTSTIASCKPKKNSNNSGPPSDRINYNKLHRGSHGSESLHAIDGSFTMEPKTKKAKVEPGSRTIRPLGSHHNWPMRMSQTGANLRSRKDDRVATC